MGKIHSVQIRTNNGIKEISVFCNDITSFEETIDVLTTSAFINSYAPSPGTIFAALHDKGINVRALAGSPEFDLRKPCHVWLSEEIHSDFTKIKRIGCIELTGLRFFDRISTETEHSMINSVYAYFRMLDIASLYGVKIDTVALPLLGNGNQRIPVHMLITPLINECISFLKRNTEVKRIYFIERNPAKAELLAKALKESYRFINNNTEDDITENAEKKKTAFISYESTDKNIADNLCFKLESNGIKVWYAPRDTNGPYAESIVKAIDSSQYFIVILSQNSLSSEHVLSEVDLAFNNISKKGIKIKPLRIDDTIFNDSFKYYLSRQHWMDATVPPLEERLNEFVKSLINS